MTAQHERGGWGLAVQLHQAVPTASVHTRAAHVVPQRQLDGPAVDHAASGTLDLTHALPCTRVWLALFDLGDTNRATRSVVSALVW
jgi:hypothetical protein